jgi:hypothetical protein
LVQAALSRPSGKTSGIESACLPGRSVKSCAQSGAIPLVGLAEHVDFDAPATRIDDSLKYQVLDLAHLHIAAFKFDELLNCSLASLPVLSFAPSGPHHPTPP